MLPHPREHHRTHDQPAERSRARADRPSPRPRAAAAAWARRAEALSEPRVAVACEPRWVDARGVDRRGVERRRECLHRAWSGIGGARTAKKDEREAGRRHADRTSRRRVARHRLHIQFAAQLPIRLEVVAERLPGPRDVRLGNDGRRLEVPASASARAHAVG
jgi:hypothetical protein